MNKAESLKRLPLITTLRRQIFNENNSSRTLPICGFELTGKSFFALLLSFMILLIAKMLNYIILKKNTFENNYAFLCRIENLFAVKFN